MKLSAPPPPPPEPNEPGQPGPEETPPGDAAGDTTPPAADTPTPPPEVKPATWPAWFGGADFVLALLAVVLAFLVSSFVARNSDVWLHLAAGKRLLAGEYTPGSDPFSYTGADRTWVNHSWLYGAATYLAYSGDGALLVGLKAAAVAAAFGLLMLIRRPGFPLWPWAAVSLLAVVAVAPYVHLRPIVGSVFLLAVTLFLFFGVTHRAGSWRFPVAIGVTFWVWANVDAWFFLGPLALALVLVGELIQGKKGDTPEGGAGEPLGALPDVQTLARALAVGVVACMLNPHHVRVWQLPFELIGMKGVTADPRFVVVLLNPLDRAYTGNAGFGYNLNGLAYAVLFVGGGAALGLAGARVRFAVVGLWVGFALLSLLSVYAIPFLAVVAVPVVAGQLNALSAGVGLKTWGDPRTRFVLLGSAGGRAVCLLAALAACVFAWPGWLHPPGSPAFSRRVAWAVEPDPAMARAAGQLQAWREQGRLPADARGFCASVELANYCAWFAPAEKVYANGRFDFHRPEWADYVTVRTSIPLIPVDERPNPAPAAAVFADRGVEYLVAHAGPGDPASHRFLVRLAGLDQLQDRDRWSAWYRDGRTTISGWRRTPAAGKPTFDALRVDPVVLAFGPDVPRLPPGAARPIRRWGGWEEEFIRSPGVSPPGADEALAWCDYRDVLLDSARARQQTVRFAAALADFVAGGRGLANLVPNLPPDESLRAVPFLALRAARRAIAADPDHPDGYFALALALADDALPIGATERVLGQVTAARQCLERMPPPDQYRHGSYIASPARATLLLSLLYLNQSSNPAGVPAGVPVDRPAFESLSAVGGTGFLVTDGKRYARASMTEPAPQGTTVVSGPYLLPVDLVREAFQRAEAYGPVAPRDELEGHAILDDLRRVFRFGVPDNPKAQAAVFEELQKIPKMLESEFAKGNNAFARDRAKAPRVPDQARLALRYNLAGTALELLAGKDVDPARDFGTEILPTLLLRVALELAVGRLEDAAADLEQLAADPTVQQSLADPEFRRQFRGLVYQKLLLEGNYAEAGRLMEELDGNVVREDPNAAVRAQFDPKPFAASKQRLGDWANFAPFAALAAPTPLDLAARTLAPAAALAGYRYQRSPTQAVLVPGFFTLREDLDALRKARADFFARRGYLFLFEGDVAEAENRFRAALEVEANLGAVIKDWGLTPYRHPTAEFYLRSIGEARKRGGK